MNYDSQIFYWTSRAFRYGLIGIKSQFGTGVYYVILPRKQMSCPVDR